MWERKTQLILFPWEDTLGKVVVCWLSRRTFTFFVLFNPRPLSSSCLRNKKPPASMTGNVIIPADSSSQRSSIFRSDPSYEIYEEKLVHYVITTQEIRQLKSPQGKSPNVSNCNTWFKTKYPLDNQRLIMVTHSTE